MRIPIIYNGLSLDSFIPLDAFATGYDSLIQSLADPTTRRKLQSKIKTRTDWETGILHAPGGWNNVLLNMDGGWAMKVPTGASMPAKGPSLHQAALLEKKKDDWAETTG